MAKHFQHFKTTQGYFSVWKNFFYLETERFLPITGAKWELTELATDESLSNFVRSCSGVESQRRCQHLIKTFRGMGTLEIEWDIMMSMQPSLTTMKTATASEQLFREKQRASGAWKETREQGRSRGWEVRAGQFLSFAADSHVRLPLEMERLLSVHKSSHTRDTMTLKCTLRWLLFFRTMLPSPRIRWTRHLYESASFWIRSPEWTFSNTLWIRNRVDATPRYFFHPVT